MAILNKAQKEVAEKKAVETKGAAAEKKGAAVKKAEPAAKVLTKTKQVMKRKVSIGKFAKTVQLKGKAVELAEAKLAMKGPLAMRGRPALAMKVEEAAKDTKKQPAAKALAMKAAVAKAAVKAKLTVMKAGKKAGKKDEEESSEEEDEEEEDEEPKKKAGRPAKKGAAAPKAKAGAKKAGKVVIGKFAKGVQQKGKAAKDVEEKKSPAAAKGKATGKAAAKAPVVSEKTLVANRKEELNKMYVADLKELAVKKGLEKASKEVMVKGLLALEAKAREEAQAREAKVKQVEKKIKDSLKEKSLSDLKELCRSKSLAIGGAKGDIVARCFAQAKKEGEVDKTLAGMAADARRAELISLDKDKLLALCKKNGVDPLVKEVMVERIVSQEAAKNGA